MHKHDFYINGKWVKSDSPDELHIINPATEKSLGTIKLGNEKDVDKAVIAARHSFHSYSQLSVKHKIDLLTTIREIYKRRLEDVAYAIQIEMGAPKHLALNSQAKVGLAHLKAAIEALNSHKTEYEYRDFIIRHEPIGVCGLITPWNWPINQILSKLAPCLASGCTAILKPSEIAPLSALVICEILDEAKVPAGAFNLINGTGQIVGEAMSSHPGIDMMSFTGSTRAGISVAKASADSVKRVSQELGGKSANIILDDELFETSIRKGVQECMENTGQSCNSPTRMLVPISRKNDAYEIAVSEAENIIVGDPNEDPTIIGPVVSNIQFEKVQKLIQIGIDEGAKLLSGGIGKPNGLKEGYYIKPTIFGEVNNNMKIAKEEIFGPVLSIIPYKNIEDAIFIANDTEYGLAAYISGKDREKLNFIARKLRAGQIHLNYSSGGAYAPFGGYKQSGNGREKEKWGLEEFLEVKAILGNQK